MNEEKEMIGNYAVVSSMRIGNMRYIFARNDDEKDKYPYMKCREYVQGYFAHYDKSIISNDYFELMRLYIQDLSEAIEQLEQDRKAIGLDDVSCLKPDDLLPADYKMNIKGKIVAIGERYMIDGQKDIAHQLYYVESGNGAYAESRENGCFSWNLYTGKKERIERYEIIGIVPEDKLPDFAKKTLEKIKEEREREER